MSRSTSARAVQHDSGLFREIFRLLRPFWPVTLFATAAGTLSGLATAWLLATINDGLHAAGGVTTGLLLRFAGLCALVVSGSAVAGVGNSIIGQKIIAALRKDISARVLRAPVSLIERHRAHKILAVLMGDVDTVSAFTFNFSGYAVAFAIAIGSFLYLLVLSPAVFVLTVAAIALGVAINLYSRRGWRKDYEGVRDAQDDLQKQYRAITEGAKELRLNSERRARVHGLLLAGAADRIADFKIHAMRQFWIADAIGVAIFFVVIGLLLAVQHRFGIDSAVISGAVLVLLYVKGPVDTVVSALPALSQAQVAFKRIAVLTADFREPDVALQAASKTAALMAESIALRDACYTFAEEAGGTGFTLGPIDLTIHRGECLFVVGENGSGKTTLIKLLLGLYIPTSGMLLLDGEPVTPERLDDYRQMFSAVFSDYYLFDDLLTSDPALAERANSYLDRLEIAHRVRVENGTFTTTDLSTGQRKRLALVHAYLEQRPIMMFDEWAADQDPTFRRIFYTELLPDLKRQGKTLIVVSHDDRYFDAADRIIRLEGGRIAEDRVATPNLAAASGAS
ncbi:MAG TPA: cyclic peptide export ABC transporter [Stellaceae bacterium]|nr:cyclic peptide export ABC transporter [Stellaceae bacterium]